MVCIYGFVKGVFSLSQYTKNTRSRFLFVGLFYPARTIIHLYSLPWCYVTSLMLCYSLICGNLHHLTGHQADRIQLGEVADTRDSWVRQFTSKGWKISLTKDSRFGAVDLGQRWGKVTNDPGHIGLSPKCRLSCSTLHDLSLGTRWNAGGPYLKPVYFIWVCHLTP